MPTRSVSFTRIFCPAPRFCAAQVIIAAEMLCSGMHAKSSTRLTALNAAITATPCALMTLWMSTLPTGWQACCSAVMEPLDSVSRSSARSMRKSPRDSRSIGTLRCMRRRHSRQLTACAITVARPAPATPHRSPAINTTSRQPLSTEESARYTTGVRESPTLRRLAERMLYWKVNRKPTKMIRR